jgi:hypothetical protein
VVTDSHSILARWRNHFSQPLNVRGQTEIYTEKLLVSDPSAFEVEMAIEKLKRHKSPGIDQIQAELIKAGGRTVRLRPINLLILLGISWNYLRIGRSRSLYLSIRRAIIKIVVIMEAYHICQLRTKFYPTSCCQGQPHMQKNYWGSSVWNSKQQLNY